MPAESELPTGTVTFMFTDIEGSTRLLQLLGDAYPALLSKHHRLLREAVEYALARLPDVEVEVAGAASRARP
jgi:class 3 adenylate cyclase